MVILRAQKRSIVLVPFPYQGHTTPMLQLGKILHSRGFSIIVAHTKFNSPNPLNHPEFIFLALEDNVSTGLGTSISNISAVVTAINENSKVSFQDSLAQMMKDRENHGYVCCIIYDAVMYFSSSVANHLNISSMVLRTFSAFYMQTHHTILRLIAENSIPLQESKMLEPVPELRVLRFKDLPIPVNTKIPQTVLEFFKDISNIGSSIGIIWNTTEDLEHISLSELRQLYKVPIFPIGPFHKIASASSTSFLKEDKSCMAWLDKQAPNSVLYISLGSLACIEEKELEETAWGLAKSGQPFLWVVRPCSVNGSNWIEQLPKGFQDCIGERCQIVKWAPQKEVLGHSAVGRFLTHCGWNSTLESLYEAVPMICRPCFSDQMANARYITHVWKVGLELEEVSDREVIGKTVKRLMIENEGKQLRQRVLDMKQKLDTSMKESGASYESLSDLTDFINSFPLGRVYPNRGLLSTKACIQAYKNYTYN